MLKWLTLTPGFDGERSGWQERTAKMIPIWRDVDVLVVGSTNRAVEAARDVRRQGRSVLVVAGHPKGGALFDA
jgi:cation diffusion facilitator CzcD-associated flavoprotein CzcO